KEIRMKHLLVAATVTAGVWLATPAWADHFFFNTGTPDGLVGALSQPPNSGRLETETADDFLLTETTSIAQATITGLCKPGSATRTWRRTGCASVPTSSPATPCTRSIRHSH